MLIWQIKLGMHGHAGNLYPLWRDTVVQQLLSSLLAGHQIKLHIIAGPTFPKAIAGVRDHSD